MERLTEHFDRDIHIEGMTAVFRSEYRESAPLNNAIIRLAAYEDAMPIELAQDLSKAEKDGALAYRRKPEEVTA